MEREITELKRIARRAQSKEYREAALDAILEILLDVLEPDDLRINAKYWNVNDMYEIEDLI